MNATEYDSALKTILIANTAISVAAIIIVIWMFLSVTRFLFLDLEKRVEELEDTLTAFTPLTETPNKETRGKPDVDHIHNNHQDTKQDADQHSIGREKSKTESVLPTHQKVE